MENKKWWIRLTRGFLYGKEGLDSPGRYRTFRRNIVILMLVVTIVPLSFMAVINYLQYRASLKNEIITPLKAIANKTAHSFELFLEERLSTVRFISSAYSFKELSDTATLKGILWVLKMEFGGFIDLGLIDSRGIQLSYAGPYELLGKDYSQQEWFQETVLKGVHISDVFMGYRKLPHLSMAVQHSERDASGWILRATIDTAKFDSLIASIDLDPESDAFLINRDGIIQTQSKFYGNVLERCPFPVPRGNFGIHVQTSIDPKGREVLVTYSNLGKPDFALVMVKPQSVVLRSWYTLKSEMFFIFFTSLGAIFLVVFTVTDILVKRIREADERRELAFRELEHSQKLSSIGRLAAGVAHEINNPMAIINEKAGLMKDLIACSEDFERKSKFIGLADSILLAVERCRAITHRLLGFARRLEVLVEVLDINDVVREVISFLEREAVNRKIEVTPELDPNLPRIPSDRGQLQQVFLNILTNAIAAVEDGGRIAVRSWEEDTERIGISIQDNGCGMSEETLSHIFEPFFTTKKDYGTGLGLPITYGIVKKLGGGFKVQSRQGVGTTFTVYLPKNQDQKLPGELYESIKSSPGR